MVDPFTIKFKLWLEKDGIPLIGSGGAKLLQAIKEEGNLKSAIKKVGVSYRYAWGYLKKLEKRLGGKIVIPHKGGFKGGGGMSITELGEKILRIYTRFNNFISVSLKNPHLWMAYGLKNLTVNRLNGSVKDVKIGSETAKVVIEVPAGNEITSIITSDSIRNLGLQSGQVVDIVIKATEVMVDKNMG